MRRLIKKLAIAIFRGRYAPKSFSKWLVLLFDCVLFFMSFWIYVFIKYLYELQNINFIMQMHYFLPIFVVFLINSFIFGSYQGLVRYSGFSDIKKIGYVCF